MDWTTLPTGAEVVLRIEFSDDIELDDNAIQGLQQSNDGNYTFRGIYNHNVTNDMVYFREPMGGLYRLFDDHGDGIGFLYEAELYLCDVRLLSMRPPVDDQTMNFVNIPAEYLETLQKHYTEFHLAYDYMDQGWMDIEVGDELEHLNGSGSDAFFVEDGDDTVSVFSGQGFWILDRDLERLSRLYATAHIDVSLALVQQKTTQTQDNGWPCY